MERGALRGVARSFATTTGSKSRDRGDHASQDITLHSARLYDWMALGYTFGREDHLRERTLDAAGITAGEQVLDVGCGTGTLTLAAKKRLGANGSVWGVDASPEMIARARTKSEQGGMPVIFEVAAAQSLPFPDAAFDAVLCSLALHHLPENARATALAEMRRVLKPDGRVLIVEFSRERGALAWLNPVALLHALRNPRMLDEATGLVQRSGFQHVVTGPLGLAGIGYVLGSRDRAQATP